MIACWLDCRDGLCSQANLTLNFPLGSETLNSRFKKGKMTRGVGKRGIHYLQRLKDANVSKDLIENGQNRVIDASLTLIRERAKLKGELLRTLGGVKASSSLLGVPPHKWHLSLSRIHKELRLQYFLHMVSLLTLQSIHQMCLPNASTQLGLCRHGQLRRNVTFTVRSEHVPSTSTSLHEDRPGRCQLLVMGTTIAPTLFFCQQTQLAFAAETKKGFLPVTDKKDGYNFLYPFGWQEVTVEGEDKVFKAEYGHKDIKSTARKSYEGRTTKEKETLKQVVANRGEKMLPEVGRQAAVTRGMKNKEQAATGTTPRKGMERNSWIGNFSPKLE